MNREQTSRKLKAALDNLHTLPAMPLIAQKLLALPLNTDAGIAQMLALIKQDANLSGKIVGLANSPVLAFGRKVRHVDEAALLLGQKRLKSVAVGIATLSKMGHQRASKSFDPQDLWMHSMTIAIIMDVISREMPKRLCPDENLIFLAGLMHDIGFMVLHHLDPAASEKLHHQIHLQPKRPIGEIELELLGMTHGDIGARLVRHWNLPEEIAEVVGLHHTPDIGQAGLRNPLVRLVNLAEKLLPNFGIAEHGSEVASDSEWRELSIDPLRAGEISELVNEVAMQVAQQPEKLGEHSVIQNSSPDKSIEVLGELPKPVSRRIESLVDEPPKPESRRIVSLVDESVSPLMRRTEPPVPAILKPVNKLLLKSAMRHPEDEPEPAPEAEPTWPSSLKSLLRRIFR